MFWKSGKQSTNRRNVDQSSQKSSNAYDTGNNPAFRLWQCIANYSDDASGQGYGAADSQGEKHQEEENSEQLKFTTISSFIRNHSLALKILGR